MLTSTTSNLLTSSSIFQQIQGTAMGAAFSPTVANIFMSVVLKNFLNNQHYQPLVLARYIDDIFIIWKDINTLDQFLKDLNEFHPKLKLTHTISLHFADFLIYKGPDFCQTRKLDFKTYQNLYQNTHPITLRTHTKPSYMESALDTYVVILDRKHLQPLSKHLRTDS